MAKLDHEEILSKIIDWGQKEEVIRAMILIGSRAQGDIADELSDHDVSVFTTNSSLFTRDTEWLDSFGDVWVYIPEKLYRGGKECPTRLVIFEGGVKVDFAFYTMENLEELQKLPDDYNVGYRVLLDKDGLTKNMPEPTCKGFQEGRPSEEEFLRVVNEFWFEAYHVAKYLVREDLWSVKFRENATHELLLRMIRWHEQARNDWDYSTDYIGKRMRSWVEKDTWDALYGCFARFDAEDGWRALHNTVHLFRRLAMATAKKLSIKYPSDVDENIYSYILSHSTNLLETDRLVLRKVSQVDLEPLSRLFSDVEVMKFSFGGTYSHEESQQILKTMIENDSKYGFGAFAVLDKKTHEWMGFCGLWWEEDDGELKTDFGYRFFPKYWGKGFAAESVKACLEYIAEKLPDVAVFSYIDPSHKGSIRVAEKTGMTFIEQSVYHNTPVLVYKY